VIKEIKGDGMSSITKESLKAEKMLRRKEGKVDKGN
jgi:hypothetical protein